MCGRYDYFPGEFSNLRIRFNLDKDLPEFRPSYNIAPGQHVPVIVRDEGRNKVKLMRWGLVPSWAEDPSIGNRMIRSTHFVHIVDSHFAQWYCDAVKGSQPIHP